MGTNPYSGGPGNNSYRVGGRKKEIDLRQEMSDLLFGSAGEVPKGRVGLLRRMRKDTNGDLIKCPCRSKITDEPDKDYYCRYCLGHGYFWDETKIVYYRNDDSFRKEKSDNPNYRGQEFEADDFFLQHHEVITPDDFIIVVKLDVDGSIAQPLQREDIFRIWSADKFRADNARVEFWRVRAERERKWSVWYGLKTR